MDPVGFGVGVVGLVGLVSTCIQGYQIVHGMNLFEHETRALFLKLNIQRLFFLQWAETCRKAPNDDSTSQGAGVFGDEVICETLQHVLVLLSKASNLQRKYGVVYRCGPSGRFTVDGDKIGYRKKLNFAITDRDDFRDIITELSTFNDVLPRLAPTMRARHDIAKALSKRPHLIEDAYAWDNDDPPHCGTGAAGVASQMANTMDHSLRRRKRRDSRHPVKPQYYLQGTKDTCRYDDLYARYQSPSSYPPLKHSDKAFRTWEDSGLEDREHSPPPPYAQSVRSNGSRHSQYSSSSRSSQYSNYSRKSSSDAAREMLGDLLGMNGRRYSTYR